MVLVLQVWNISKPEWTLDMRFWRKNSVSRWVQCHAIFFIEQPEIAGPARNVALISLVPSTWSQSSLCIAVWLFSWVLRPTGRRHWREDFQKGCKSWLKTNPIKIEPSKRVFAVGIAVLDCLNVLAADRPVNYPVRRENNRLWLAA